MGFIIENFPYLLHGADYNPEQWLDNPDVLEEDIRWMKEAEFNCVTLGVFSWAVLEPEEGSFHFEWLDDIIEKLYKNGIRTILATPTGAVPHWLGTKYPQVLQTKEDGVKNLPGKRHNFCCSSKIMRVKMREINTKLAKRYGSNPGVIAWHISNEYGGNFSDASCHCESCQEKFRKWLKDRYQTLEGLNRAWYTVFWSHTYSGWEQVHSPAARGETTIPALLIDWKRFVSDNICDFCQDEAAVIRSYSSKPLTVNMMDFFEPVDYFKLKDCVDFVSWDSYPAWHEKDDTETAVRASGCHSLMRSLKKKPFLLMESTPSVVNWRKSNLLKRPGMHELSSILALAHGSDSIQYFQWRKGRGGFEQYHGAVIDHRNGNHTRVFRDVQKLGKKLKVLSGTICGSCNHPKCAIIFDWENWWALESITGPVSDFAYLETVLSHFQAFWNLGIDIDFLNMDADFSGYRLVAAPLSYMYREGYVKKAEAYVKEGGIYVSTYWSGMADESNLCFLGANPLCSVLGVEIEEIDAAVKQRRNIISYQGKQYKCKDLCELSHVKTARVLARYEKEFYAGYPAVTVNDFGKGKAYYLACETEEAFLREFYRGIAEKYQLEGHGLTLPPGVTATVRYQENGDKIYFILNFTEEEKHVLLAEMHEYVDAEAGEHYKNEVVLESLGYKILFEKM